MHNETFERLKIDGRGSILNQRYIVLRVNEERLQQLREKWETFWAGLTIIGFILLVGTLEHYIGKRQVYTCFKSF